MRRYKRSGGKVGPICVALSVAVLGACVVWPNAESAFAGIKELYTETTTAPATTVGFEVEDRPSPDTHINAAQADDNFGFEVERVDMDGTEVGSSTGVLGFAVTGAAGEDRQFVYDDLGFEVEEYLEISTTSGSTVSNVNMTSSAVTDSFFAGSTQFAVSGNNANGFDVYVYTADEASRSLSGATAGNTQKIAPIGSALEQAATAMADNTWGYNLFYTGSGSGGNTSSVNSFMAVPQASSVNTSKRAFRTTTPASDVNFTLTCGTKVSTTIPDDTYSTQVTISAVAPYDTSLIAP